MFPIRNNILKSVNVLCCDFDTIVVGGGLGGLTAAALLAARGVNVALLEAHTVTGGCAGFFDRFEKGQFGDRQRYRFDVGATTISGAIAGQPLHRLFRLLGGDPPMRRINPGMICHLPDGAKVVRWDEHERWLAGCSLWFGKDGQREFWECVQETSRRAWQLSGVNRTFPPKSLADLFHMIRPANLRSLDLLRYTRVSVLDMMRRFGVDHNKRFVRFVDEQLMITAQNKAEDTPFLIGAMGLSYPHEVWYAEGGMSGLVHFMEDAVKRGGGEIRTKRRVTGMQQDGKEWILQTSRETYRARRVISNLTVWDLADLLRDLPPSPSAQKFSQSAEQAGQGWGALTLYTAVRDDFDDLGTLYHQIHCEQLPGFDADSIFVSFSPVEDRKRAPQGWRTVTASVHVADPKQWKQLAARNGSEYTARKQELEKGMLDIIGKALPGFARVERKFTLMGTPRTFEFFARRKDGMVGGVPHTLGRNLLYAQKYRTPFSNLFMVGDTVYPGQGVPAVVLGAMNLVEEIGGNNTLE